MKEINHILYLLCLTNSAWPGGRPGGLPGACQVAGQAGSSDTYMEKISIIHNT